MDFVEVKVSVPVERETDFYRWFADWRDRAAAQVRAEVSGQRVSADPTAAAAWWGLLTQKERAIWSLWSRSSPAMVPASRIVEELGLGAAREIPGILSWSGRKGKRVGFDVDWRFRTEPMSGEPIYGIEDEAYAAVLREVQQTASAAPEASGLSSDAGGR